MHRARIDKPDSAWVSVAPTPRNLGPTALTGIFWGISGRFVRSFAGPAAERGPQTPTSSADPCSKPRALALHAAARGLHARRLGRVIGFGIGSFRPRKRRD